MSCAGQVPPSGGPPDTTPPTIVSTFPEPHTTGFSGQRVLLEFSKYVDRRSVEESIFISPDVGPLEYDWSGREVEIRFEQPLRSDITYVVTVGTDVVDRRNKNRMAEAFSLAFSTGATIDSASLTGIVFDPKSEGVTIFAFSLDDIASDTLDPSRLKPAYATQTGKDGTFTLNYLAWAAYRLFAVRDQYKNILYDPQVDQIGMTSRDFVVHPERPAVGGIKFQLTLEDTTPHFVLDGRALNKNTVRIRFSEALDIRTIVPESFSILDTVSGMQMPIRDIYLNPGMTNVVHVLTEDMDSSRVYRITARDVRDTAGNVINPQSNAAAFVGSAHADTLVPQILSTGMQDSARNVLYDAVLDVLMSEGVKRRTFERGFALVDSSGKSIPGQFRWWGSAAVRFFPDEPLLPLAWYRVRIVLDSVQDYTGNRLRDSVVVKSFQTIDWRKFGSMRGIVEDVTGGDTSSIFISARNISDMTAVPMVKRLDAAVEFSFDDVLEGQYVLWAFRDRDGNGQYTYGRSFPFVPSERFTVYPDTVKVRARWPVEGILLRFDGN